MQSIPSATPDPLDRLRPEAGEDVQREAGQAERRVARGAAARRVLDVDLGHGRAAGEDERLRELLPADRAEHRLDGGAAVGVERAAEVGDLDAGEAAQHPVDQAARQRPAPRVVPRGAAAARDVVAGLDRLDEPRDVLRLVLEVAVHRHDDLAARAREAGVHRRVLAEVALEADGVDARRRRRAARSSAANVPSVEPSSTTISSNGRPRPSSVATVRRTSSSSVAASFSTVTTTESCGAGSPSCSARRLGPGEDVCLRHREPKPSRPAVAVRCRRGPVRRGEDRGRVRDRGARGRGRAATRRRRRGARPGDAADDRCARRAADHGRALLVLRRDLGLPRAVALFAVGYNALVVLVKFVLGPRIGLRGERARGS